MRARTRLGRFDFRAALFVALALPLANHSQAQPAITNQPQNQIVPLGYDVTFRVRADGTPPLAYQWKFGSTAIADATNSWLRLWNVQFTNAGDYSVSVSNTAGTTPSSNATLVVTPPGSTLRSIPATNVVDFVYDSARDVIYLTTATAIQRYHVGSNIFLTPIACGVNLYGIDLSLDGNTLVAADYSRVTNKCGIWAIDLPTETIQAVKYDPGYDETGTMWVAFGNDGAVLATSDVTSYGIVALRRIHPGSNYVSDIIAVEDASFLAASPDGSTIAVTEWHSTASRVLRYNVETQATTIGSTGWAWANEYRPALSPGGAQLAAPTTYGGTFIFDPAFNIITNIAGQNGGLIYHPSNNIAFFAWSGSREIRALDTAAFEELWRYDFGTNVPANTFLRTSRDGSLILAMMEGAVRLLRWTNAAPVITNQPTSRTVSPDSNVTFTVGAEGPPPLRYQWRFQNEDVEDATNATFFVNNAHVTNNGIYCVAVLGPNSFTLSSNVTLIVNGAPYVTTQPQGQTLPAGTNCSFSAAAVGPGPFSYRWQLFSTNLVAPDTNVLSLTNLQAGNAGDYAVVVSNKFGYATSEVATLVVIPTLPFLTQQPQGFTGPAGTNVTFTVSATGTEPFSYQWLFNGTNLPGRTAATLTLTNIQSPNIGDYSVIVSNSVGTNTSDIATLIVTAAPPTFIVQPQSVGATLGAEVLFNATAVGTEPINYQWQFGSSDFAGATGPNLVFTNVAYTNTGNYAAVATNVLGSATSTVATLTVTPPPGFLWARSGGGTSSTEARCVAADAAGNTFVAGYFLESANIGGSNIVSAGSTDFFVARFDPAGHLVWVRQGGGSGGDQAYGIAVDGAGNVFVTGYIFGDATIGTAFLPSHGGYDVFLARYDFDGNLIWATNAGGVSADQAFKVAVDNATNVYVTGSFSSLAEFGANILSSSGVADVFVARYDANNGNCLWARKGGSTHSDQGLGVACDGNGNVLVTGEFVGPTASFGSISITNASVGSADIFIVKYDSAGNVLWANRCGGTGTDSPQAIRTDAAGSIYVFGYYFMQALFENVTLNGAGQTDAFLAKFNTAGALQWVTSVGGTSAEYGLGLELDAAGNAFATGTFSGPADFGGFSLTNGGSTDVFVAMFAPNGTVRWALRAGGSSSDYGRTIAVDGQGKVYIAGSFYSSCAFGHQTLTASGGPDFFLAKLAAFDAAQPPVVTVNLSNQTVLAGATFTLAAGFESIQPAWFQWQFHGVDLAGATNALLTISNAAAAQAGDYSLVLSNANGAVTSAVATVSVTIEPDFIWAWRGGGTTNDTALATVVDVSGNVYAAGYFSDTADFGTTNLVSNGGEDIFVVKYSPIGTPVWVKQFGSAGNDRATALAAVPGGGVAVGGNYSDTLVMGTTTLTNAGGSDVFLARLDGNGNVAWAVRGGGTNTDLARGVAVSSIAQQFFLTGSLQTNATFGSSTFNDAATSNKLFIVSYDSGGNFNWAASTTSTGPSQGCAIAADPGNFVYLAGTFGGTANFGGTSLSTTGALAAFVAKYSSGGNITSWARRYGATTNTPAFNLLANGIALDTNFNVFVTGSFQGDVMFLATNSASSWNTNQPDAFLLKFDRNGNAQWVRTINGPGADAGNSVSVDPLGNAYVTGTFSNRALIGNTTLAGVGGQEMFVALFDSLGTLVKARRAGGVADDVGQSVATDGAGNVFVAGGHGTPAAFGSNILATAGAADAFLTRLRFFGAQTLAQITTQPRSQTVVQGSNATLNAGVVSGLPVTYRWRFNGMNLTGATTNSFTLVNAQLTNVGDYTVVVQSGAGVVTSTVAKVALEVSPEFLWLRRSGTNSDDQALAVALDGTNAVYVAGLFTGTNPNFTNLTSAGGTDIFLAKYDREGNLLWAKRAGGTLNDAAQALRVDGAGNVLVAGYFFSGSAVFDGITLTNKSAPVASFSDLFLAKYDATGNLLWVRQGGGTTNPNILNRNDTATAITTDDDGNAYVTGSYHSTMDLSGVQLANLNSTNFFVAKFDGDGNVLWARTTTGTNSSQGSGICVDAATNVYVTGFLIGSLNLGSGVLTNLNNAFLNATVFIAKYDRDGGLQWARKAPGSGAGYGQTIIADAVGAVYATSYKRDYGSGVCLTKYDNSGNVIWYRTAAISCCTGDYTSAAGLALDAFGNPIVAGYGNGSIEGITNFFGGGYVLKYRSDGTGYWFQRCASAAATGTGSAAVVVDAANNAFLAGRFTGTSFFGATNNLVSAGGNDAFLIRLGSLPVALSQTPTNLLVIASSNVTLGLTVTGTGPFAYQWQFNGTNIAGATQKLFTLNNFTFTNAGRYSVVVQNAAGSVSGQVAALGFIPVLNVSLAGNDVALSWDGEFVLQSATNVAGPYTDLKSATSPFTNPFAQDGPQRFFRLRVGDPALTGVLLPNQWFSVGLTGSPGRIYTIQGSTNLVNWMPLQADASPFTLQDSNAVTLPQRFYRAVLAP